MSWLARPRVLSRERVVRPRRSAMSRKGVMPVRSMASAKGAVLVKGVMLARSVPPAKGAVLVTSGRGVLEAPRSDWIVAGALSANFGVVRVAVRGVTRRDVHRVNRRDVEPGKADLASAAGSGSSGVSNPGAGLGATQDPRVAQEPGGTRAGGAGGLR